jgi:hypothetical protein
LSNIVVWQVPTVALKNKTPSLIASPARIDHEMKVQTASRPAAVFSPAPTDIKMNDHTPAISATVMV